MGWTVVGETLTNTQLLVQPEQVLHEDKSIRLD